MNTRLIHEHGKNDFTPHPATVKVQTAKVVDPATICSAGEYDRAVYAAAEAIIVGLAANTQYDPDWIEEAARIIKRELRPVIRDVLSPMLLNPASPRVRKIWPAAVDRASRMIDQTW